MIGRLVGFALHQRFIVLALAAVLTAVGRWQSSTGAVTLNCITPVKAGRTNQVSERLPVGVDEYAPVRITRDPVGRPGATRSCSRRRILRRPRQSRAAAAPRCR